MSPMSIEGLFMIVGAIIVFVWSLRDDTDGDGPGGPGGRERHGDLAPHRVRIDPPDSR